MPRQSTVRDIKLVESSVSSRSDTASFIYIEEELCVARIELCVGFLTSLACIESVAVDSKREDALTCGRIGGSFTRDCVEGKERCWGTISGDKSDLLELSLSRTRLIEERGLVTVEAGFCIRVRRLGQIELIYHTRNCRRNSLAGSYNRALLPLACPPRHRFDWVRGSTTSSLSLSSTKIDGGDADFRLCIF